MHTFSEKCGVLQITHTVLVGKKFQKRHGNTSQYKSKLPCSVITCDNHLFVPRLPFPRLRVFEIGRQASPSSVGEIPRRESIRRRRRRRSHWMDIITSCVPNGSGVREKETSWGHAHVMSAKFLDLLSPLLSFAQKKEI